MKSIIQECTDSCYLCGNRATEVHHIFGGALRKKCDKYGLTVHLCHDCHNEPPYGVHHHKPKMDLLHRIGQRAAMERYGWSEIDFRAEFYKNYL